MKLKITAFLACCLFIQFYIFGQETEFNPNNKHQIGWAVGTGISKLQVKASNFPSASGEDSIISISSEFSPKFDVLLVYQYNFNPTFSIRPTFGLILNDAGKLIFNKKQTSKIIKIQEDPIILAIPVGFKLSQNKIAPFLSGGPAFLFLIPSPKDEEMKIQLKRPDTLLNVGAGLDIIARNFIVSPEIKISTGLLNLKPVENNYYNSCITNLKRKAISFTLSFRG